MSTEREAARLPLSPSDPRNGGGLGHSSVDGPRTDQLPIELGENGDTAWLVATHAIRRYDARRDAFRMGVASVTQAARGRRTYGSECAATFGPGASIDFRCLAGRQEAGEGDKGLTVADSGVSAGQMETPERFPIGWAGMLG